MKEKYGSNPEPRKKKNRTMELLHTLKDSAAMNRPKSPPAQIKINGDLFLSFCPVLEMAYILDDRIVVFSNKLFSEGINSVFALKQCSYDDLRSMTFQIGEAWSLIAVLEGVEALLRSF